MVTNEARAKLNLPPIDGGDELVTPMNVIVGDNPKPSPQVMPVQDPNAPAQDGSHREQPKALRRPRNTPAQGRPGAQLPQHRPRAGRRRAPLRPPRALARKQKAKAIDWARWDREFSDDIHQLVDRHRREVEGSIYAFKLSAVST
jgi:hypothetical protein